MIAAARARAMRVLMAGLWAGSILRIFVDAPGLRDISVAVLVLYLLLALPSCTRLSRRIAAVVGGAALLLSAATGNWWPLLDGLIFALVFTSFLPTLLVLRATIDVSPEVWRSRAVFATMPPAERASGMLAGGGVLGAVLTLGVFPVLAPLVPRDAKGDTRGEMARACLRGLALTLFWSPFTVNMAVALAFRPDVPLWQVIGAGLPLAVIGVGLSVALFGRSGGVRGVLRALAGFGPILAPLGGAMLAVLAAASFTPLGTIQAIVLVMPVLCAAWLLAKRSSLPAAVAQRTWRRLDGLGSDLLVFAAAVSLGRVVLETPWFASLLAQPAVAALPTEVILAGALLLGFALALAGGHSLVIAALIIALLTPFGGRIADLVAVQVILFGAACGAVVSVSALSVLVAAGSFRVPIPVLLFRQNIAFMVALGVILFLLLTTLNRALVG